MSEIFGQNFFERDSFEVAHDLMGQHLCRQTTKEVLKYTLNEIEVYDGFDDKASHAHGKESSQGRSKIMFGSPGHWYVYLCYGVHWMLNVVTREKGYPAALLIRGCLEVEGPGRLTKALKINKSFNGLPVDLSSQLWIEKTKLHPKTKIIRTPRIGVDYAGAWAKRDYRLVIEK